MKIIMREIATLVLLLVATILALIEFIIDVVYQIIRQARRLYRVALSKFMRLCKPLYKNKQGCDKAFDIQIKKLEKGL